MNPSTEQDFQLVTVDDLSLYIHIPFCSHRCHYCHFYFEITRSDQVHHRTLEQILRESRWYRDRYQEVGPLPRVETVYLGGGTPSLLSPAALDSFLETLEELWAYGTQRPREVTLEANPESLGPELLEVLARRKVDRISLGVQSFHQDMLRVLGRQAGPPELDRALANVEQSRKTWGLPRTLSLDLIIGIPGQTTEILRRDLELLLERQPDHVSLYQLSIDPGTPLHQSLVKGRIKALESEQQEELWTLADRILLDRGWENYEISNYARGPEHRSRHNLRYWEWKPYLGLGPGASGTLPARDLSASGEGAVRPLRIVNPELLDYGRYMDRPGETQPPLVRGQGAEKEWLNNRDWFVELLITGLRTAHGTPWQSLDQCCGGRARQILAPWLESLAVRDLYRPNPLADRLSLARSGRFLLDPLLVELLQILPEADSEQWKAGS